MRKVFSAVILSIPFFISGCGKKKEITEDIRSIKTITISELATGQTRNYSGVVHATDYSYLGFEGIGGRVLTVNADIGENVKKGQILASLDKETFNLNVQAAQADLVKANAQLAKAVSDYDRELALFKKQASYQARLDSRKFQKESAESQVELATSKLNLAKRDMQKTDLLSPYNGRIGKRMVEPHDEVKAGQALFKIDAAGSLEVQFSVPESAVPYLKINQPATVRFTAFPGEVAEARLSYLGSAADKGNAFPAKVELITPPKNISPGISAEVSILLAEKSKRTGYLIPAQAILPGKEPGTCFVFVYDLNSSTVHKKIVKGRGSQGNMGVIDEGLAPGDIIAVAGVSFLADGMKVKLYTPQGK